MDRTIFCEAQGSSRNFFLSLGFPFNTAWLRKVLCKYRLLLTKAIAVILIFISGISVINAATCSSRISPSVGYYAFGGRNISIPNALQARSWEELANNIKAATEAANRGYELRIIYPLGLSNIICYELRINGAVYNDGGWDPIYNGVSCGAYAYNFASYSNVCPSTYTYKYINYYNYYCERDADFINSGVCPAPGKELGVPQFCASGNPINHATGNKLQVDVDYAGSGSMPLVFRRFYNSKGGKQLRVGYNWRTGFDKYIYTVGDSVTAIRDDGRFYSFSLVNDVWISTPDVTDKLEPLLDGNGNRSGWKYTSSENDQVEIYNDKGKLTSIANRAGLKQTLNYDQLEKLISINDPFGRSLTFSYDASSRLSKMVDPAGGVYTYSYDTAGRLISVTYPDNKARTYLYENTTYPYALTGIIDESGSRFATYTYDAQGRAVISEHADGAERVSISYGTDGTGSVTDALGMLRNYSFDTLGGEVKNTAINAACSACGSQSSMATYDANGFVSSRTDFNSNKTTYIHDQRGLEISRTEAADTALARTIATEWHPIFRLPVKITQPNRVITLDYDTQGNLLQRTISAGGLARTWKYIYNAQGLMTSVNGPRLDMTDITTYTYDASGNLTSIINALNQVTQITSYDAHGHPLTIKEPNGLVTQLQYDTRGRLISSTIGTEVTSYTYNTVGQIASITLPTGAYLNYSYDSAHRLIQISDSLDNRIVYTLDSMGNRLKEEIFDANNTLTQTRAHVYNQLNRLAQDIGAQSQITNYSYDNNGNNTGAIDPLNHAINNIYDSLNRLIQVVDPSNGATQYTYDANDQITQVIDPKGLSTAYNYDGLGNLSQVQSPDSGMTSRTYDEAGNPKTETDALGKLTTYIYDALNRVKKITYADGALVSFLYDGAANAVGRLYRIYDPNGDTLWSYDTQGRVTQKQQTGGGLSLRISYTYNGQGQLASITYPSGKVIQYSYNQGQVSAIAVAAQPLLNNVQHQPFGAAKNWQWGNGVNYTRQFDQDGRLVSYVLGTSMRTLSYDAADRITGMTIPVNQSLSYDSLDRLIQYSTPTTNQSYSYDSNGNRTALSIDANTYPYTYASASNRLNQINGPIFSTYTYNAAGSLIQDNGHSYIYSATGRLARVSYGASNNYYKINGLGQRVRKYGAGVVSGMNVFMYDESGHLIGEYDASGLPIEETIYLENVPVAVLRGNNIYYIHADHLNAPRVITDTSNRIVWRWDSDPFGVGAANEDPDGDLVKFNYNLRFPGQYFDKETGLYYNMARDYDSQTGRYIQSDPIGLAGGLNPYTYVSNNPLSFIDPLGLAQVTYDSRNQTVTVYEGGSTKVHQFPAGNNTTSTSNGPWPSGTFPFDRWKAHPESGPDGPYGSFGNFIFDVPGRTGMGIHSGRSGPQSKTEGCIRTTDDATELLDRLSNNPNPRLRDPITVISVW